MKAYVRYIIDSTDENIIPTHLVYSKEPNEKGIKNIITTKNGTVNTIGIGEIEFNNENDLIIKVNNILKEMGY